MAAGTPRGSSILVRRRATPSEVRLVRGLRHAGEGVYPAAVRAVREARLGDPAPWARDLSHRVSVFACEVADEVSLDHLPVVRDVTVTTALGGVPATVAIRQMTRGDLPDVVRWVAAEHVARWWEPGEAADLDAAERHYGPALDGADPTRMWVMEVNGRSVGFVQDYRIGDHPDFALLTAEPDAVGFDYAIGEPAWVGRGVGTRVLWQFLADVVRPHYPGATTYFAAPDHRNAASLRVLDKLGFTRGLWFDEPRSDGTVATVVGCRLDVRRMFGRSPRLVTDG